MSDWLQQKSACRRPGPGTAAAVFAGFLGSAFAAGHVVHHLSTSLLHDTATVLLLGATVGIEAVLACVLFCLFPAWFRELLASPEGFLTGVRSYIRFLPFFLLVMTISIFLLFAAGVRPEAQKIAREVMKISSFPVLGAIIVAGCVVAPFLEEIIFRGAVHSGVRSVCSPAAGVGLSAVLFAAVHQEPTGFAGLCAIGIMLAILLETQQTLWACVGFHVANNMVAMAAILAVRAVISTGGANAPF